MRRTARPVRQMLITARADIRPGTRIEAAPARRARQEVIEVSIYGSRTRGYDSSVASAARELFEAEIAFRDARQSGVAEWIAAAADHLHRAVEAYGAELAAVATSAA